ncbi:peptidase M23 [Ruegeria sp. HKCCSP351]|uniref:peptidase M23 n=1 Tax=Ruegeria sp. HKCCSP351 TaxID=2794832 RepID=UPI001AE108DF|nr:peptidase M23 [Ruegeria sp. HKCCSP351]
MTRMLFPVLILAGPAAAHNGTHIHAHGTDYAALAVGFAIVALAAVALMVKLNK